MSKKSLHPELFLHLTENISDKQFAKFKKLVFDISGIEISDNKKIWLVGRLSQRFKILGCTSFLDYFNHVNGKNGAPELQVMLDLLTTNETYFFREPEHFNFLRDRATCHRKGSTFRVWSAASSSGEEAYTMAMVLAETLGNAAWEILGTDISTKVLDKAKTGHYPLARTDGIPYPLLKKYCRKGILEQNGTLLINKELRKRVQFLQCNLMDPPRNLGAFDVIFLRNVMIYFKKETKKKVIANLMPYLKPDGRFVVGHCESLYQLTNDLVAEQPTIYRRSLM